jgi:hypothetical protein
MNVDLAHKLREHALRMEGPETTRLENQAVTLMEDAADALEALANLASDRLAVLERI